jgi:transketolase
MRAEFSDALVAACRRDPRVMLLTGDHGYALFDPLRSACPDQYLNAGIAEQNMVGVAAGMAKAGLRPIVYGLSAFMPVRTLEQIKMDVCYEGLPVIFIGDGAGVVYSSLGTSHQSTEDVSALRAVPQITILSPADGPEMQACMQLALELDSPVYLRMGKADLGVIHAEPPTLAPGNLLKVRGGGGSLTWIATGSMVHTALRAADAWPESAVWSAPCIKPLDVDTVATICDRSEAVIVLEEHSVYGGLGSAVAEISAEHAPTRVLRVGIQDRFSQFCGSYNYLMSEHQLTVADVERQVRGFLAKFDKSTSQPIPLPARQRRNAA